MYTLFALSAGQWGILLHCAGGGRDPVRLATFRADVDHSMVVTSSRSPDSGSCVISKTTPTLLMEMYGYSKPFYSFAVACQPEPVSRLRYIAIIAMAFDLIVLIVTLAGLTRLASSSNLWRLLLRDSIVYCTGESNSTL